MISNLVIRGGLCFPSAMIHISRSLFRTALAIFLVPTFAAASKPHAIVFGKWTSVQWNPESGVNPEGQKSLTMKVRPLLIDARVREFTFGSPHEITERLFVVRRALRVNDSLPQESAPHWRWQRGGWLLIDRTTGRISVINLIEFDVLYSATSWYRDYAAYCGVADDGKKRYAVVVQIGRRKPVLNILLDGGNYVAGETPDGSACPDPAWQRNPSRVTFEPAGMPKQTFAIRGHTVDVVTEENEDEEASK